MSDPIEVYELLPVIARPLILERFSVDSCIISTAVAIDVLDYFGIDAEAVEVSTLAFNAEALELYQQQVPTDDWPDTAWSIGTTREAQDDRPRKHKAWHGAHLIAVTDDYLIDLSADQHTRPFKRMRFEPLVAPFDRGPFEHGGIAVFEGEEGAFISYERYADQQPRSWTSTPDWQPSRRRPIVGATIRQLKRELTR